MREPIETGTVARREPVLEDVEVLPVEVLPEGEIAPPRRNDDPTWDLVGNWFDPLKPRYARPLGSNKNRIDTPEGVPALLFGSYDNSLICGEPCWRDYTVYGRVRALQGYGLPRDDDRLCKHARIGLVFRIDTVRRYYFFGIESQQRVVLAYREDDTWHELAGQDVQCGHRPLDLRVSLDGDGISAHCQGVPWDEFDPISVAWPEVDLRFHVTDTRVKSGRAGFRSIGQSHLFSLAIAMTPSQKRRIERAAARARQALLDRESRLPPAEEAYQITPPEGTSLIACDRFGQQGPGNLLFSSAERLVATDWKGDQLWEISSPSNIKSVSEGAQSGRRVIYALGGARARKHRRLVGGGWYMLGASRRRQLFEANEQCEWTESTLPEELIAIDGNTGRILGRAELPELEEIDIVKGFDLSYEGAVDPEDGNPAIILRISSGGGNTVWAYDAELRLLWDWEDLSYPEFGHHNAVHLTEVRGCGPCVLAGGRLLDAKGRELWMHDRSHEVRDHDGARHYDACLIGSFSGDEEIDPVAFLAAGDPGVFVVDGLTGRTRASHRVGHAQWLLSGTVLDDAEDTQILCGSRWGNFGILTLLSGRGERLWSVQHEYILQRSMPVQWLPEGPQHIWLNQTKSAFGLLDGRGEMVSRLRPMREYFAGMTMAPIWKLRPRPEATDHLAI